MSIERLCATALAGVLIAGCGSSAAPVGVTPDGGDPTATIALETPVLLDNGAPPCTEAHTVCMTVKMPDSIPGAPTHLAVGYFTGVPVKTLALARGVIESPPLVAGQTFRLMAKDGNLNRALYPVVLVYMPGGGDVIAVDNLDYTAEATQTYNLTGAPINISETLTLIFGI